jgi:CBS domain-containing protein
MRLSAAPPAVSGWRAEAPSAPAPRAAPRARAPRAPPAAAHPAAARAARPRGSTLPARAKLQDDGTYDVDALDVDSLALDDPYGVVGDVMTTGELRRATPGQSLATAAALLDKVTGVAVVDSLEANLVLGVLSIKDVNRVRKAGTSLEVAIVDSHMSTPPIVVRARARIGEAAALMLARGIHRLPVVDGEGRLIGIVSRTDIFAPLLNQKADVYAALDAMPKEAAERIRAALRRSEKAKAREAEADARDVWMIKVRGRGGCWVGGWVVVPLDSALNCHLLFIIVD